MNTKFEDLWKYILYKNIFFIYIIYLQLFHFLIFI